MRQVPLNPDSQGDQFFLSPPARQCIGDAVHRRCPGPDALFRRYTAGRPHGAPPEAGVRRNPAERFNSMSVDEYFPCGPGVQRSQCPDWRCRCGYVVRGAELRRNPHANASLMKSVSIVDASQP